MAAAATKNFKTKLCKSFSTPQGCRFGAKCHFIHPGEPEPTPLKTEEKGGLSKESIEAMMDFFSKPQEVEGKSRPCIDCGCTKDRPPHHQQCRDCHRKSLPDEKKIS